jgi:hypothetical protein
LQRCTSGIVAEWLTRVKRNKTLASENPVSATEKSDSICSAAGAHGKVRRLQGDTPGMLVHDSRMVTLFRTLQGNLSALDLSLILPDVMMIADEVHSQLTQAIDSYMNAELKPAVA